MLVVKTKLFQIPSQTKKDVNYWFQYCKDFSWSAILQRICSKIDLLDVAVQMQGKDLEVIWMKKIWARICELKVI